MPALPSLFPLFDIDNQQLSDGSEIAACDFCKKAIHSRSECVKHYESLTTKSPGFYHCPFGFTSRSFYFQGVLRVVTGIVAFPRFNTPEERAMGKRYSAVKISRKSVDTYIQLLTEIERVQADAIQQAAKVLPQALHELRKLNAAVLQHAERELARQEDNPSLLSIRSAAELMRNNFDILEALSNIESMKALPSDSTINLYDLVYKVKKVLQERANEKGMVINVNGVRAIVRGSQKSFPIVPAVLLENAIKYGKQNSNIRADISVMGNTAMLSVENQSASFIDTEKCFERGARYASNVEGGGFGLYIAREIVSCHKGAISCETNGASVRLTVRMPLHKVIAS